MPRTLKLMFAAIAVVAVATPSLAAPPDRSNSQYARDAVRYSGNVFRQDGKLLGRDPDANIRFELNRDGYANEN